MANAGQILAPRTTLHDRREARAGRHRPVRAIADESLASRVERIANGDNTAREWLYERYAAVLYRRLKGRYGSGHNFDPEELLQDAFVWFFQHDARVLICFLKKTPTAEQNEAAFEGYLWGLACGVASNRRRSLRRSPLVTMSASRERNAAFDTEARNIDRDILFRLAQCLKKNGSRVYLYYTLRYVDGLTPEEVSTATGWSRKSTYKLKSSLNDAVTRCVRFLRL